MRIASYASQAALAEAAALAIAQQAKSATRERGRFTLVLSGGSTPKPIYELLANESSIDWQHIHLFWGDERFVPHDDPQSNYRMAKESLIDKIAIPRENIHPVPIMADPTDSANAYANELRSFFKSDIPKFDLILLGLGEDGHTASLFPGPEFNPSENRVVISTHSPKPPIDRISLSLSIINEARNVFFLVSGKDKKGILKAVVADSENSKSEYPAAYVKPRGELVWFVDTDASPRD